MENTETTMPDIEQLAMALMSIVGLTHNALHTETQRALPLLHDLPELAQFDEPTKGAIIARWLNATELALYQIRTAMIRMADTIKAYEINNPDLDAMVMQLHEIQEKVQQNLEKKSDENKVQ